VITECWTEDGVNWTEMQPTMLPNPDSGIDAVTLKDGRALLVYNHASRRWKRYPLNVAISSDGKRWRALRVLEDRPGEYSYPAMIQGRDGLVHIAYTWNRKRIKYAVLDPADFAFSDIRGHTWQY
jgi:alpha-L-rhamnosidase